MVDAGPEPVYDEKLREPPPPPPPPPPPTPHHHWGGNTMSDLFDPVSVYSGQVRNFNLLVES